MKKTTTQRTNSALDAIDDRGDRRTVIPTPRANGIFSGWGVRF